VDKICIVRGGSCQGWGIVLGKERLDNWVGEECSEVWPDFGLPFRWFERDDDVQEGFNGFFNCGKIGHGGGVRSRGVLRDALPR